MITPTDFKVKPSTIKSSADNERGRTDVHAVGVRNYGYPCVRILSTTIKCIDKIIRIDSIVDINEPVICKLRAKFYAIRGDIMGQYAI